MHIALITGEVTPVQGHPEQESWVTDSASNGRCLVQVRARRSVVRLPSLQRTELNEGPEVVGGRPSFAQRRQTPLQERTGSGEVARFVQDESQVALRAGKPKTVAESLPAGTALLQSYAGPQSGALGPDGAFWSIERSAAKVGRMTLDGAFTAYPLAPGAFPNRIVAGPDGALWFTELLAGKIGRITTGGVLTEFPIAGGRWASRSGRMGSSTSISTRPAVSTASIWKGR